MLFATSIFLLALVEYVSARDMNGRYANSALHDWFNQLASGKGPCCSVADGQFVDDPDWELKNGHYRVYLDGRWIDVPDDAVVKSPNRVGRTVVWPLGSEDQTLIRCFLPGSMT